MALGPNTINRELLTAQTERIVDKAIRNSTGNRVTIATSILPSGFSDIWLQLSTKYLQAGWKKAVIVYDQRDGDFIDLQA